MEDFVFTPLVIAFGLGLHSALLRMHTPQEGKLLSLGFFLHVGGGIAHVLVTTEYFQIGDLTGYYQWGVPVAETLRIDFFRFAPEVFKGFLQRTDLLMPAPLFGGGSTLSMSAAASFVLFFTGNSLYAACVLMGVFSYVSKVLLYRAFRDDFPAEKHTAILAGALLLPSAVFWSSAILKEPMVMVALGPLVLALRFLIERRRTVLAVLMGAPAVLTIVMIKPYVLMALSVAGGAFLVSARLRVRGSAVLKPFAVVPALILAFGGLVIGSRYMAKFDARDTASAIATQRRAAYSAGGGSAIDLGDASASDDAANRSVVAELALAPLALGTALFRPLIFEARNAIQLVSALEMMMLLVMFAQGVRLRGWRGIFAMIWNSPVLLFCFAMTLALGLGTGLSSPNLGTLSRYRTPMMPFFFMLLLVLRYRQEVSPARAMLARLPAPSAAKP
jgi:hypothetical protein